MECQGVAARSVAHHTREWIIIFATAPGIVASVFVIFSFLGNVQSLGS